MYANEIGTLFLKCSKGDASLAADQLAQHFETKRELFATEGNCGILARDIMQSDLSEEEMQILETSSLQVLPSRDVAGRLVLFNAPNANTKGLNVSASIDQTTFYRTYWYFNQCIWREEGAAEQGYIVINYFMEEFAYIIPLKAVEGVVNKLIDGLCTKMVVEHFCCDDEKYRDWAESSYTFAGDHYRHRLRIHYGTPKEVMFQMQTYGIPTGDIPLVTISEEEEAKRSYPRLYMAQEVAKSSKGQGRNKGERNFRVYNHS